MVLFLKNCKSHSKHTPCLELLSGRLRMSIILFQTSIMALNQRWQDFCMEKLLTSTFPGLVIENVADSSPTYFFLHREDGMWWKVCGEATRPQNERTHFVPTPDFLYRVQYIYYIRKKPINVNE